MATIKEVATKARVSVGTVSNVLSGNVPVSDHLRERVLEVIKQLDYHPDHIARSLKVRHTNLIGIVVNDIVRTAVAQLIRGAEDAAWHANYMLISFNSDDHALRQREVLTALRSRRVDGLLLKAGLHSDHNHIASLRDAGIPIVCVERELPGLGLDCVVADQFAGARECVQHMVSVGRRRIALLNGDAEDPAEHERHLGYRQGLEDAGIGYDDSLIVPTGSGTDEADGKIRDLLRRSPHPTAVLTPGTFLAGRLLRAIRQKPLNCPGDVAIAAFEDSPAAEALYPAVTVVAQPSFEMGRQALDLLLKRIKDPHRRRQRIVLQPTLVIRESSGTSRATS